MKIDGWFSGITQIIPLAEKELVSIVPFEIAERNLKYTGINLTKGTKDLYGEITKY